MSGRANNFDLIRFTLAGIVVLSHIHVLSQDTRLAFLSRFLSPDIAVKGFFVVSGYLILRSWDGSTGFGDYAAKRARRIYPAYAVIVLCCALLGALLTTLPVSRYFSLQWLRYLGANLVFLNFLAPTLPGVFAGNPEATVNGALWTLKIEVMFYVAVPILAWLIHRYGAVAVSVTIYVASVAYSLGMLHLGDITGHHIFWTLAHQLPGQLSFFMGGALLYYKENTVRRWLLPGAALSIGLLAVGGPVIDPVLRPILLSLTVIYFATAFPYLGNFGRFGDFSYGIYIIHFPVLQWLVSMGWFHAAPFSTLLLACVAILAAAFACWHLVERPFLFRSSHYVAAARPPHRVPAGPLG
jgi:peptidoglycan/LPS O-acetylase OafA/YrhL